MLPVPLSSKGSNQGANDGWC